MLQPKRTKFRKQFRKTGLRKQRRIATRGNTISFGDIGLVSTDPGLLTSRQIEAARRAITRHIKRVGKVIIRVFPDKPITKKPLEVRQGKGKGNVEYWVSVVQSGTVIFELDGVEKQLAREAFRLGSMKLSVRTTIQERTVM